MSVWFGYAVRFQSNLLRWFLRSIFFWTDHNLMQKWTKKSPMREMISRAQFKIVFRSPGIFLKFHLIFIWFIHSHTLKKKYFFSFLFDPFYLFFSFWFLNQNVSSSVNLEKSWDAKSFGETESLGVGWIWSIAVWCWWIGSIWVRLWGNICTWAVCNWSGVSDVGRVSNWSRVSDLGCVSNWSRVSDWGRVSDWSRVSDWGSVGNWGWVSLNGMDSWDSFNGVDSWGSLNGMHS